MLMTSEGVAFDLVNVGQLYPHEQVVERNVDVLVNELALARVLHNPLIVGSNSFVILDGHHRFGALRRLGFSFVPVVFVREDERFLSLSSRRDNFNVSIEEVVRMAHSGLLFPPKTTRFVPLVPVGSISFQIDLLRVETNSGLLSKL